MSILRDKTEKRTISKKLVGTIVDVVTILSFILFSAPIVYKIINPERIHMIHMVTFALVSVSLLAITLFFVIRMDEYIIDTTIDEPKEKKSENI